MTKTASNTDPSAAALIAARINELGDWRGDMLARLRALIKEAVPEVSEEWKWATPVWSSHGLICTGEAYKKIVKMTFPRGASLPDPTGLFNSSLEGGVRRAIDFQQDQELDRAALKDLVRAAASLNAQVGARARPPSTRVRRGPARRA